MGGRHQEKLQPLVFQTAATAADFCVVRTAALSTRDFAIAGGLASATKELCARPDVREGLYLASPSLSTEIPDWLARPTKADGRSRRVATSLQTYILRMATRPMPFGVFGASSLIECGDADAFTLGPQKRKTRITAEYLRHLAQHISQDRQCIRGLRYTLNPTSLLTDTTVRCQEVNDSGASRTVSLSLVDRMEYLDAVLELASSETSWSSIVNILQRLDDELEDDDITEFIADLVASEVLVPRLFSPSPDGHGLDELIDFVWTLPSNSLTDALPGLAVAREQLDSLDEATAPPSDSHVTYDEIHRLLPMNERFAAQKCLRVDAVRDPGTSTISEPTLCNIAAGGELLHAFVELSGESTMTHWASRFFERYEQHEIPLMEVLDDEMGMGAPALAPRQSTLTPQARSLLLERLCHTGQSNAPVLLDADDVAPLLQARRTQLPASFAAVAHLYHGGYTAVDRITGPNAAAEVSDVAYAYPEFAAKIRACAERQYLHVKPELSAEVVYAPKTDATDWQRPRLADYEIPVLGTASVSKDNEIPPSDLLISVTLTKEVILRSRRLAKIINPRITVRNASENDHPVMRFFCALQDHTGFAKLTWNWGEFESFARLPRIQAGNIVLAPARWRLNLDDYAHTSCAARLSQLQTQGLPHWVALSPSSDSLRFDLRDPTMRRLAAREISRTRAQAVYETFGPDDSRISNSTGPLAHEVIVPCSVPQQKRQWARLGQLQHDDLKIKFAPGSEWLYFKVYTGRAACDRILSEIFPVIQAAQADGLFKRWFFIRFADPDWHLRFRFFGDPNTLTSQLAPKFLASINQFVDDKTVWRICVDTYEREADRYGREYGMALSEELFQVDSEASIRILDFLRDAERPVDEDRWLLSVIGIDALLEDMGLALPERITIADATRKLYGGRAGSDNRIGRRRLGVRFRKDAQRIQELYHAWTGAPHPLTPAIEILKWRSREIRAIADKLHQGLDSMPVTMGQLARSYVHMFTFRLIQADQNRNEGELYDFLIRRYRATQAGHLKQVALLV